MSATMEELYRAQNKGLVRWFQKNLRGVGGARREDEDGNACTTESSEQAEDAAQECWVRFLRSPPPEFNAQLLYFVAKQVLWNLRTREFARTKGNEQLQNGTAQITAARSCKLCDENHYAGGLCEIHYKRQYRGSPLEGRPKRAPCACGRRYYSMGRCKQCYARHRLQVRAEQAARRPEKAPRRAPPKLDPGPKRCPACMERLIPAGEAFCPLCSSREAA